MKPATDGGQSKKLGAKGEPCRGWCDDPLIRGDKTASYRCDYSWECKDLTFYNMDLKTEKLHQELIIAHGLNGQAHRQSIKYQQ